MKPKQKQKLDGVEYVKELDGTFTLYTCIAASAKKIGARFDHKEKCYIARNQKAPQGRRYKLRYAKRDELKKVRREYARFLKLQEDMDKLVRTAEKQETLLVNLLLRKGINIKRGKPRDRQLLGGPKTRLHHCQSVHQNFDAEAAERLATKHPAIARCFKKKTVQSFDRAELLAILPSLPAATERAILKFEIQESFREIHLSKAECDQCGGKVGHDGVCKTCKKQHPAPLAARPRRSRYQRRKVA